ncbi:MAG: metal-dependent hydrolase [Candidatus Moraniibacteriota bacterium]
MPDIRFLGHAAFQLAFDDVMVLIDPWITGNPKSPLSFFDDIVAADLILVTHDHYDHGFEDAVSITKRTGATLVAISGFANKFKKEGVTDLVSGNLGGTVETHGFRITFFPAIHSVPTGSPCGFVVRHRDFSFYHSGDTAFFGDMALLAEEHLDLAFLPIGSTYTMDMRDAARAVEAIMPATVIPMHYDTFTTIKADPKEFEHLVGDTAKVVILTPGETVNL